MAACKGCGTKVPLLTSECAACANIRRAAESAAQKEALLGQVRAREERQHAYVTEALARLAATFSAGRSVSLYESIYVPVDSVVNDESLANDFDLLQIQTLGWQGWDVVGVVPRTVGVGLVNVGGGSKAWGAGMGGNVAGVHILLRLIVQPAEAQAAGPLLEEHLARTFRG
jgi:hypothetical protein